ncbi:MAG: type II toxin-antitoxin system VapC family toxin [Anaerolineae bacterium]|nr:type II toxin-antitoxin system VapC family toxin [Anaerolineae bacterium]
MSVFFADISALIKHYIAETGSAWVSSWAAQTAGHTVVISRLTTAEMIGGLARRQREQTITQADLLALRNTFFNHVDKVYSVINLNKDVLEAAGNLLIQQPLRTLDAIQLAAGLKAAQTFPGLTFVSADTRLLAAASAEGLPIDDPNAHP